MSIHAVAVYCSSSNSIAPHYFAAGAELGRAIAQNNWKLVYGGNAIGLMKVVADAARAGGGKVIGITPKLFVEKGLEDKLCDELVVTDDMRDRKAVLEARGDAFVALPGGLGTFEEVFDIITSKQLRFHDKPIVLLNVAGYFDPLLQMIDNGIEHKFIRPKAREYYFVARDVPHAIEYLRSYRPPLRDANFNSGLPFSTD